MLKQKIILFIAIALFPMFLLAAEQTVIVFDAGSSGTRLNLFSVSSDTAHPQITSLGSAKATPGIADASLQNDPNLYAAYFANLFKAVDSKLTAEQKAATPMYLYATAGMRIQTEAAQTKIMSEVRSNLVNQAKSYGYAAIANPETNFRVISGGEEGLFIWLADNDINGNLASNDKLNITNTFGAMELGGASAEISFLAPHAHHFTEHVRHNNETYKLYSTGYDGLGADQTAATVLKHYQTNGGDLAACYPKGASYPLDNPVLVGEGNFAHCQAFLEKVMINHADRAHCKQEHSDNCSGFGRYQPTTPQTNYLLTSGFYYTFKVLGVADQGITTTTFKQAATEFCAKPWDELKQQYPAEVPQYLVNYCLGATWMSTMFEQWHIGSDANIMAVDKKDGVSISWPEGAAYYHATHETPQHAQSQSSR